MRFNTKKLLFNNPIVTVYCRLNDNSVRSLLLLDIPWSVLGVLSLQIYDATTSQHKVHKAILRDVNTH